MLHAADVRDPAEVDQSSQREGETGRLSGQQLRDYARDGFVVIRGLFTAEEMLELQRESDRLLTDRKDLINPRNVRCRYMKHYATGEPLFEVFDPVNDISPVCERFTLDARLLGIMETLYGESALLFKEKLIFKPAGALGYNLHQDIPRYWKGFPASFVTVLIPIDQTNRQNGCTEVFSGYHADFLSDNPEVYMLPDDTVDPARRTCLELEPGDIAIFHGLTPHRSDANQSNSMRRTLYVSYNKASDGGDQRAAHYAEFGEKMRKRLQETGVEAYFE
jgi:ectoine hydroxylase-related dioxygenase (phytanoyl-CoA dioxygenase family)